MPGAPIVADGGGDRPGVFEVAFGFPGGFGHDQKKELWTGDSAGQQGAHRAQDIDRETTEAIFIHWSVALVKTALSPSINRPSLRDRVYAASGCGICSVSVRGTGCRTRWRARAAPGAEIAWGNKTPMDCQRMGSAIALDEKYCLADVLTASDAGAGMRRPYPFNISFVPLILTMPLASMVILPLTFNV